MRQFVSYSELACYDSSEQARIDISRGKETDRDPDEYEKKYIQGLTFPDTRPQILGKIMHKALEHPSFRWERALLEGHLMDRNRLITFDPMPEMVQNFIPIIGKIARYRLGNPELSIRGTTKDGIHLYGELDDCDLPKPGEHRPKETIHWIMNEYKTYESANPNSREAWYLSQVLGHKQLRFYNWILMLRNHRFFRQNRLYAIDLSTTKVEEFEVQFGLRDIQDIEEWARAQIAGIKKRGWWELRLSSQERKKLANGKLFQEPAKIGE